MSLIPTSYIHLKFTAVISLISVSHTYCHCKAHCWHVTYSSTVYPLPSQSSLSCYLFQHLVPPKDHSYHVTFFSFIYPSEGHCCHVTCCNTHHHHKATCCHDISSTIQPSHSSLLSCDLVQQSTTMYLLSSHGSLLSCDLVQQSTAMYLLSSHSSLLSCDLVHRHVPTVIP